MEKERKITAPEGCEIEKVEIVNGAAVVTFKEKERILPKSWEEFCEIYPVKQGECSINYLSEIMEEDEDLECRNAITMRKILPDRATAEAVLALCQLIQLRNCYNGDWVPDWMNEEEEKYTIEFRIATTIFDKHEISSTSPLYFKSKELREEFQSCFRQLVEKLKPLYGIAKGGEK